MFEQGKRMTRAKVKLPKAQTHAAHPFRNRKNHKSLLEYCRERLMLGKDLRDRELTRLAHVDKKVAGWIRLSQQDKIRERQTLDEGDPAMTKIALPLGWVHLDDMMTYFAQTFAPTRGMFYHTAQPDEVPEAVQLIQKMNNDALQTGYFRELMVSIFSLLKYNKGGYWMNWSRQYGPVLVQEDPNEAPTLDQQIRWQGNKLKAIDNYNWLRDPSVPLHRLHQDGEFAGEAEILSYHLLQKRASEGFYFNCEEALEKSQDLPTTKYYRNPVTEAAIESSAWENGQDSGSTNWLNILSASTEYTKVAGFEAVTLYIKLNPTQFGLVPGGVQRQMRDRLETWRVTILNDEYIIEATHMNNMHGMLPCFAGSLNDDLIGDAQKSAAEIITPLQDFASHLVNTHVEGSRSKLYGTTFYDPTMVNMDAIPKGEVAARVPVNSAAYGKDIRTFISKFNGDLDTRETMNDLESVMGLINQFFPTQSLPSQIASIDRAVTNQVAAVQQGANRRQQKAARQIDDTILRPMRFAMYYNIVQYQPDNEEIIDAFTGKRIVLDVKKIRGANLPYIIGQGLKAIDRMAAAQMLQTLVFALIQTPQASQQFDLAGLIDYWTSMIDVDVDMKQFRIQPQEQQPVDQNGQPIQPAVDPSAVTAPMR